MAATHVRLRFILVRGEAAADVRLQLLPFSVHPRVRGGDTRMSLSCGSACGSASRAGIRLLALGEVTVSVSLTHRSP